VLYAQGEILRVTRRPQLDNRRLVNLRKAFGEFDATVPYPGLIFWTKETLGYLLKKGACQPAHVD